MGPLPILVLPGLDGTADLRADLMAQLRQSRPATLVAYPGRSVLDYAALDALVRTSLPEGRFVVLGESFAGPAAIKLAHAMPDRVAGLILASTFAKNPWPSWLAPAATLLDQRLGPDFAIEWIMLGDRSTPDTRRVLGAVAQAMPRDVLQARAKAALRIDLSPELAATTCPVLCIHSCSDWLIRPRCARHLAMLRPVCEMVWLDGGHDLLLTHPNECAAAINRFCERIGTI